MTGAAWAVEIDRLEKSYHSGRRGGRVDAIRSLTLRLAPGQVLGLLGPNGSGKSTALRALAGLLRPTAGECRVCGHPAGSDGARALTGYLPDSPGFPAHLTARGFLRYCAGLSSLAREVAERRIEALMAWTGLGCAAERRVTEYSRGMRQRLGLAQAVLHEPEVILLDEPSNGLDPAGRLELDRLIGDLAARGRTVVFSSHLLAEAAERCDHIALLGSGRLLAEGPPSELLGAGRKGTAGPTAIERIYLERIGAGE